ncbi:MAG TPA: YtxH domain-containing protein [Longimicrobium sp.]|nr:YtxH domain-containing protein [Longimicrobium sp.]
MRSHDENDDLEIVIEERGSGLRTFALGVLVGAGAALLLAPRAGRETQRDLARVLGGLRERGAGGTASSVGSWVGSTRGRVTGRLDDVRQAVDDGLGKVRGAVEEGRMAATQARGELRRRMEEARETYRSGRAGTPPVRLPSSATPQVVRPAAEVVITGSTTERGAGDLAG